MREASIIIMTTTTATTTTTTFSNVSNVSQSAARLPRHSAMTWYPDRSMRPDLFVL